MADVRFDVLGPLLVRRDGGPVELSRGRQRRVLADLLVHAGRPVAVDALVEAGWAVELPANPRAALYTTVARLRAALGDHVVRSSPAGYLLDVSDDQIDARCFERLRSMAMDTSPRVAGDLLDEALAWWRGSAYEEFADLEFATIEAHRLDELRLDAIERREWLRIDANECAEAASVLSGVVETHPYRERAIELLMTALYRTGRATEALDRYRSYRTMLADDLGLDPSPALRRLEEAIIGHDLTRNPSSRAVYVPAWLDTSTAFIGRDDDQRRLTDALQTSRLATVTGPGGVGKTRLVAQSLPRLAERLDTPVAVVELGTARSGSAAAAVAEALGLTRASVSVRSDVLDYLAITDLLLVLDDCEHLLEEIADLAEAVVNRCPRVRVLATSRHRLGVATEQVIALSPLDALAPTAGPERAPHLTPAVRLLTDRIRRLRPAYTPTEDTRRAAADICRWADGLPLAIELAATQVAVLGLGAVRDRLARDPMALDDRYGSSVSVRAMIESSLRLRTAQQRRALAMMSVFCGDFDLDAAETVVRDVGDGPPGASVASTLGELAEASLLSVRAADGRVRYRMLTLIRAVAADLLDELGLVDTVDRAHATWAARIAESAAADSVGPAGGDAFARLDANRAGIAAAARWALGAGDLRLAGAITGSIELCPHWSPDTELADVIVMVGERCAHGGAATAALPVAAAAMALADRGDLERAQTLAIRARDLAGTPRETYLALLALGVASLYAGDLGTPARCWREIATMSRLPIAYRAEAESSLAFLDGQRDDDGSARRHAARAIELAGAAGAPAVHAFALYAHGEVAARHDRADGLAILREAADRARAAGADHVDQVARLAALGTLVRLGQRDQAVELASTLLPDERRAGAWPRLWTTVRILAELFASDRPEDAAFLLAAAEVEPSAPPLVGADLQRYEQLGSALTERLGATVVARIALFVRGVPRVQILDRAIAMLERRTAVR